MEKSLKIHTKIFKGPMKIPQSGSKLSISKDSVRELFGEVKIA